MSIWAQFAAGFATAYLASTVSESYLHRTVGHASPRLRRLWAHHPRLFGRLLQAHYRHAVVHHGLTFAADHVTQFRDEADRDRVNRIVASRDDPCIQGERYGLTIGPRGLFTFNATLLPLLPALYGLAGPFACAGATPAMLAAPLLSMLVHPYLHLSYAEALRLAPRPLAPLIRSPFYRAIARHHYLHHVYQRSNFNLLPGGDRLLRTHRDASPDDLREMASIGVPVH